MKLRELRKQAGLTMKQLGSAVGVAESTMSLYESGKRQPDFVTMKKFADYFGVSVDYLMDVTVANVEEQYSADEQTLLRGFRALPDDGKKEILEYLKFKNGGTIK